MVIRWQTASRMCDFKNSFAPDFVNIDRAKQIFSRKIFFAGFRNDLAKGGKLKKWKELDPILL